MLTDSHNFRQQPDDGNHSRSSEHPSDNGSTPSKNAHQFSEAVDRAFYELWVALPSWSPIRIVDGSWRTHVTTSGKKVPLTLQAVERAYRLDKIIGKRFGQLTNYQMLDIDAKSIYHPSNGSLQPILDALEKLGLCRYLFICSSDSGGLHIYFPLPEPVNCWTLVCAVHAALSQAGIDISNGQCELFPNKKTFNAEHHGHRLPLQAGSLILDDDFAPISNSKTDFMQMWQLAATKQAETLSADITQGARGNRHSEASAIGALPPICWTRAGESNDIMRELVNYGDRYVGLKTVKDLAEWIVQVAPQLPGFHEFASRESKSDLRRRNWAYRWAKSHFKHQRAYFAKRSPDHNATVAEQAKQRILDAVAELGKLTGLGKKAIWRKVCGVCRLLEGVAPSYTTFMKHWEAVKVLLGRADDLGPSRPLAEIRPISLTSA